MDDPNALSVAQLTDQLGLHSLKRKWHVQPTVAIRGDVLDCYNSFFGRFVSIYGTINGQAVGCKGTLNDYALWTEQPTPVAEVANGKLFVTGPENNTVNVIHVYGTPYQMGYAHGQLLAPKIQKMIPLFFQYGELSIAQFVEKFSDRIPKVLLEIIEKLGLEAALDYIIEETRPFTPPYFYEELKGLADGSGVSYTLLLQVHMFPELTKAACSIIGAWGDATDEEFRLLQLRALDWGLSSPLNAYPMVIVYHPQAGNGNPFSVLGWTGFIGALTGYSRNLGISQKVWLMYDGEYKHAGIPFYFILRDMLQYDNTVQEAITRIQDAHRTCSIFLGIGSNSTMTADVVEYSYSYVNIFNDTTPFPGYKPSPPQHPILKDIVYVDRHPQPSSDPCLASLLQTYYGAISPLNIIDTVSQSQTGDLHIAIYDYYNNQMYVSVAATTVTDYPFPPGTVISPAFANQFIQLDMNTLLTLPY
ncbi:acid ceramidase-like protein [Cavenderia fasciculata]|uniref:Acid ceramidase-like protein n=1 Tax=Cavenderia fasciculata TaxID=261658 RepID=F4PN59_CACFS|nr:acid ceramidase-like protein [Cavenderia fasciculata]EGG23749.1 acid ceramidase-like protein [Cavenderia fasciculata]|eukprot:XP_004361600.1 acid ceramidase-like protein [Cavenderia fasciculata]